jgi:hypothetical protein
MTDNGKTKGAYANAAAMRRRYALHLLQQASDASPVRHPLQALARAIQGGLGGYYMRQLEREEQANRAHASMRPGTTIPLPRPRPDAAPGVEAQSPGHQPHQSASHASLRAAPMMPAFSPTAAPTAEPPITVSVAPPQAAIDLLRRRPELRTEFDLKYGEGTAAHALGGH